MQVVGSTAYLANGYTGLRILDVSEPSAIRELGNLPTYRSLDVAISGTHAFVAGNFSGLRVIDVSNPTAPTELSFVDTPGYARDVVVSGERTYVADGRDGLRIIDIADASAPREARLVQLSGDYAHVGDTEWLRVIDVSNPAAPQEVGSHTTPGTVTEGLWVDGRTAYVAAHQGGLLVFDFK